MRKPPALKSNKRALSDLLPRRATGTLEKTRSKENFKASKSRLHKGMHQKYRANQVAVFPRTARTYLLRTSLRAEASRPD